MAEAGVGYRDRQVIDPRGPRFGGTITIGFDTYRAVVEDIIRSVIRAGFRRIALLNGHGGNENGLRVIADEPPSTFPRG